MKIVPRIVTADRELVFESPWGNKVHFKMGTSPYTDLRVKYWMEELSPAIELKLLMLKNKYDAEYKLELFRESGKSHLLSSVLALLQIDGTSNVPWVPCKEDEPLVKGYLEDCFDTMPMYYDANLLEEYRIRDLGEQVSVKHPLMTKVHFLSGRSVWTYNKKYSSLVAFIKGIHHVTNGRNLVNNYLAYGPEGPYLNSLKYLASKVK